MCVCVCTCMCLYVYVCAHVFQLDIIDLVCISELMTISYKDIYIFIIQELCESRGGRPGLSVLTSLLASVDVKIY